MECRRVKHQGAKSFNSGNLRQTLTFSSAVCRTGTMQSSHCWRYPASYLSRDFAVQWGILCIRISLGCCQGDKKCASQEMLRWATKEIIWKSKPLTVRRGRGSGSLRRTSPICERFQCFHSPRHTSWIIYFFYENLSYDNILTQKIPLSFSFMRPDPVSYTRAHPVRRFAVRSCWFA